MSNCGISTHNALCTETCQVQQSVWTLEENSLKGLHQKLHYPYSPRLIPIHQHLLLVGAMQGLKLCSNPFELTSP
jgi:hypothetical protein